MFVSSLTSSKYWDIGENYFNWTHSRPNSRLSQKRNEFMYWQWYQTSNRHIQAIMNNKFIILDSLAANKSGILDWRSDFWDWSISSHPIWKVMPSRHLTEYNTLRDNALHMRTQHWSIHWKRGAAACLERYVQRHMLCLCVM